jgi:hypothetical protein
MKTRAVYLQKSSSWFRYAESIKYDGDTLIHLLLFHTQGDVPMFWPERCYSWGVAESFNKDHGDLLSLRALLFKEALEDIVLSKKQRYEAWRRYHLRKRWFGHLFLNLTFRFLVPVAVFRQVWKKVKLGI